MKHVAASCAAASLGLAAILLVAFSSQPVLASSRAPIVIVGDKSWAPLMYVGENNQAHGLVVDIWKLWSQKTGVEIEFRLMDWEKALHAVESGQADVVGYIIRAEERAHRFDFSIPFFEIPSVIFYEKSLCCPNKIEEFKDIQIGAVAEDYVVTYMQKQFPEIVITLFPSYEDVVDAAIAGRIKAFAMDTPVGHYYLSKKAGGGDFKVLAEHIYSIKHHAGVKKGNTELLELINRGLSSISDKEMQAISASWSGTMIQKPFPWAWIGIISLSIIIFVSLVSVWNRQLRKMVSQAVAEIKKKQTQLELSEKKYHGIFENAIEGIFQSSFDGRFLNVNPALAHILGYNSPEELMRSVTDIKEQLYVDPERREELIDRIRNGERVSRFESELYRKDGSTIWALINAHGADGDDANSSYIEGMVLDVTTIKNAVLSIQKAKEEAERADRMKSEMLFSVSHELKTPLTVLLGFFKIIDKKFRRHIAPNIACGDDKCQREVRAFEQNLAIIQADCERLRALIAHFFDLAELKSGLVDWKMEPVSIERLVTDALDRCRGEAMAKNLDLVVAIAPETPEAYGSGVALAEALGHLLDNALKFTDSGSIVCKAARQDEAIAISVEDTGTGIAPETLPHIFDLFSQGGDILTSKPAGVGLGLAIADEIVRRHGGTITAESVSGRGSVFTMRLPSQNLSANPGWGLHDRVE